MDQSKHNLPQAKSQLTKQERRQLKEQHQREERASARRKRTMKRAMNTALAILIIGGGILAAVWYASTARNSPPTTMQGHTEVLPQSHISDKSIPDPVQRHMLEHADGTGKPGIIIQYNCQKYACEPDLVEKLKNLAKAYPDNVYLAPNNYDAKIFLSKLNRREILDTFDENKIKQFIAN
jgi:hypothetical protein